MAIQSIDRAAAILQALGGGPRRLGVSELSEQLGLAKGTVHGLLKALQQARFVEQEADSGKYQLGAALLQLGNIYLDVNELRGRSLAWADNLAIRTGEAVRVGTLHDDGVLIIHHVFRPDNTLQILEVGAHLPLHATALGKALLAHDDALAADGARTAASAAHAGDAHHPRGPRARRSRRCASTPTRPSARRRSSARPRSRRRSSTAATRRPARSASPAPSERLYAKREPRPELVVQVREAARAITRDLGGARF